MIRLLFALTLLLSGMAAAQTIENPGFETVLPTDQLQPDKWSIKKTEGFSVQLDPSVRKSGAQSLRIASTATAPKGFQSFTQTSPLTLDRATF